MRVRVVLCVFAVLAVLTAGSVYLLVHHIAGQLPLPVIVNQDCTATADGTVTLDPDQMANAATIAAVGITRHLPARAVTVALATAQQESKLRNLDGGDRDSVGLFQQRPSQGWGRADQIADPRYATNRFYTALLKIKKWQSLSIATAAQKVQRSADGTAYEQWEGSATILTAALLGDKPGAVACTITDPPAQRGSGAVDELTHDVSLDWGKIKTVNSQGVLGIELSASGSRTGWQYAHWLVAHAADQGIKSVTYNNQRWTAKAGTWGTAPSARPSTGTGGTHVIAEVYAEQG